MAFELGVLSLIQAAEESAKNNWPLFLIPLFPLIGVIINGFFTRKAPEKLIGVIGSAVIGASFVAACVAFFKLIQLPPEERLIVNTLYTWISSGDPTLGGLQVPVAFMLDPLSCVMALVVSGVSFVIHVYSVGYMRGEKGFRRYFTYLNLFVFFMLLLVLGSNMLVMFVGWEGVGLCSYLLIGYYYEKKSASDAGKKAFIVNRIGDYGFLLGIFLTFTTFKTLDFVSLQTAVGPYFYGSAVVTAITLLLFVGATGKSAQIPLYMWLPDAMEGPTPVSALIHAATMVTAGVYMVARMSFMYALAPISMAVVASVGAITAIYAASIGFAQNDIKRVLAYSTISQLGYMFLAVGVGAYAAGIFHLMTHAFFKALLFLGAGSVMHALGGELDIRKMGNLKKYMPATFWTFFIATLAISGIPGLSGFFSKDEILWGAFSQPNGHLVLWIIGLVTAGMTAFYMFRALFMAFLGQERLTEELKHHVHESPKVMTVPLVILAILSVIGGYVGIPSEKLNVINKFMEPSFEAATSAIKAYAPQRYVSHYAEWIVMALSVVLALLGIYFAYLFYIKKPVLAKGFTEKFPTIYDVVSNKYYYDDWNNYLVVQPLKRASTNFLWGFFDTKIIDGAVNGSAWLARSVGGLLRRLQSGYVFNYALAIVVGLVFVFGYIVLF